MGEKGKQSRRAFGAAFGLGALSLTLPAAADNAPQASTHAWVTHASREDDKARSRRALESAGFEITASTRNAVFGTRDGCLGVFYCEGGVAFLCVSGRDIQTADSLTTLVRSRF
ncbi:MAG: hypothetical protein AAGE52_28755 [Myxococcota bacterium]